MTTEIEVLSNVSLRDSNTFAVEARAHAYVRISETEQLSRLVQDATLAQLPRLVLGGGSNILLTRDFPGLVIHMCNTGIHVEREDAQYTYVRAAAGENWHRFVLWTLEHGHPGLENLSLIPGTVGAAPIQNIGAYGAEVMEFIEVVKVFDFESGRTYEIAGDACQFSYRDSIFKHSLKDRVAILEVGFRLPKAWQARLRYADVAQALEALPNPTPQQISAAVIAIRQRKLPDPAIIGNAGSFFKNPLVSAQTQAQLLARFTNLVSYPQADGSFKLAAGWLIDQCGWKGKTLGAAGVYDKQALVLVNRGGATGGDVLALARVIQADVQAKFGVMLEPEPVFV